MSDLHLQPTDGALVDDAPEVVAEILDSHTEFESVFLLGDVLESLVLLPAEVPSVATAPRLRHVWERLIARRDLRVIPGNHDALAHEALIALLGASAVHSGGFDVDRTRFVHGHERGGVLDSLGESVGRWGVPLAVTLRRLGWRGSGSSLIEDNASIARTQRGSCGYVVFGHTHEPEISETYANSGCILRSPGRQTFTTIADEIVTLWEVLHDE